MKSRYIKRHEFTDPKDISNFNNKVKIYLNTKFSRKQGDGLHKISKELKLGYMQTVYTYCSALVKIENYLKSKGYDNFNENIGIIRA